MNTFGRCLQVISIALIIAIPVTLIAGVWSALADDEYHFWTMEEGDDAYVVCVDGHIQADFTMAHPRPTPTNSPYPGGPNTSYQTSVYIVCTSEEVELQSIHDKSYLPAVEK